MSSHSPKRARTASEPPEESPLLPRGITRSETFWLEDGNIVIQALDGKQFRVHKSILSMHSIFFRDMFATVAAHPENEPRVDECPVVHMQDESADWETILGLFYTPTFVNPGHKTVAARHLLSMLRLGRKYQFDDVHETAMSRLQEEFPKRLHLFDQLYEVHLGAFPHGGFTQCYCGRMVCQTADLVDMINYATEWSIREILPVAYYLATAQLKLEEIINGVVRPDGSRAILCRPALDVILRGRESIKNDLFKYWFPWLCQPTELLEEVIPVRNCKHKDLCRQIRRDEFDVKFLSSIARPSVSVTAHALQSLPVEFILSEASAEWEDGRHLWCSPCLTAMQSHYDHCREVMFENLPAYFGMANVVG